MCPPVCSPWSGAIEAAVDVFAGAIGACVGTVGGAIDRVARIVEVAFGRAEGFVGGGIDIADRVTRGGGGIGGDRIAGFGGLVLRILAAGGDAKGERGGEDQQALHESGLPGKTSNPPQTPLRPFRSALTAYKDIFIC